MGGNITSSDGHISLTFSLVGDDTTSPTFNSWKEVAEYLHTNGDYVGLSNCDICTPDNTKKEGYSSDGDDLLEELTPFQLFEALVDTDV